MQSSNQNVGGQRLFVGEQSYDIRGIGLGQVRKPAGPRQDGGPAADSPDQPFQVHIMVVWVRIMVVWGSGTGLGH